MPRKILVVEDDADIRRGLSIRLRVNGYDTVTADDGISAVAMAQREKPDLILLDLGLPGGDGYLVMERLRTVAPEVPVIVLSARDPLLNRARALESGAHAFLQKPADNEELLSTLRRVLVVDGDVDSRPLHGAREKILIVEDDPDIRRGLSIRLKVNNYETVMAGDGITAISMAQREKPDLILLDLGLPGGDGFVVMERLRTVAPNAPIIVLSARDPLLNRGRALDAGALEFLQKPADNEELLDHIRRALSSMANLCC